MTPTTPIPNSIMAMLRHLSGEEFKVVGVLCHRAFSLQQPQTSLEQIQALSGLVAQMVKPTLARLERRGLVRQQGSLYQIVGTARAEVLPPGPVRSSPRRPTGAGQAESALPRGPWLTENGRLDEDFVRDRAEVWRKGNTFRSQAFGEMAIEDVMGSVCKHYLKVENHANLEIDWQSYLSKNQRYLGNVQERMRSGVAIDLDEQAEVLRKLPLFQQSLDLVYEAAAAPAELPEVAQRPALRPLITPQPNGAQPAGSLTAIGLSAANLAAVMPAAVRSMPKPSFQRNSLSRRDRLKLWLSDPVLRQEALREASRLGYGIIYGDSGQPIDLEENADIAS
ncbi:MAG: hypothetical protein HC860_07360 [Alkalinema sp. RU_4_3]|nr:hypothetical protein [Alkalinema sp. RU_4_3]